MRNLSKLFVIGIFSPVGLAVLISGCAGSLDNQKMAAQLSNTSPSPAANAAVNAAANTGANTKPDGSKTIPKEFTLGKDSTSEYGEVPFNHDTHAFQNYSPDGKAVIGCAECHHTDQPKSALKAPLVTSTRDAVLTMAVYQSSSAKVQSCRDCHYQEGNVPDGKEMPTATYKTGDKSETKELNNEIAYHINCNTCHDAAAALRPDLKKKAGFATAKDCKICHKPQ
jgi:hypothetical protein